MLLYNISGRLRAEHHLTIQLRQVFCAAIIILSLAFPSWALGATSLQFLGAARTVGGSACLLETGKAKILIDFGLFMSHEDRNLNSILPFDPSSIDYVLLTHAHSDHGGRIPLLYQNGFRGKVVGTGATKTLTGAILGAGIDYKDREKTPLFRSQDIEATMTNFISLAYDRKIDLSPELAVRFRDAGHILGSAMIEIWCREGAKTMKIVFTGDMGNPSIPLLKAPFIIREGDYIVVEATYGAIQRSVNKAAQFGAEIHKALQGGGSVLIPAFTLDRTQKVLFTLGRLKQEGVVSKQTPVYVDSGMGKKITRIYRQYIKLFHPEARKLADGGQDLFNFPGLHDVSAAEAIRAHDLGKPAIYLTSSGMMDHGNAPQHLEKMIEDPRNLLAIVGWQAPGSLGSRLLAGEGRVRLPVPKEEEGRARADNVEKDVKMRIMQFDLFSNHADACQIMGWLAGFGKTKQVFVVHGAKENTIELARIIERNLGFKAVAPVLYDRIILSADEQDRSLKTGAIPCAGLGGGEAGKGAVDF